MRTQPFVLLFTGPSGAGKSSVLKRLLKADDRLAFSVSCTTRAPREGEVDGRDYHFLDRATFERQRDEGAFVESAVVHGELYGTRRADVRAMLDAGRIPVLDIDVQGGVAVMPVYGAELVSVFLFPPSFEELERRLRARGTESEDSIALRLQNARGEIALAGEYTYWVVNERLDACAEAVRGILAAESARRERWPAPPVEPPPAC